VVELRADDMIDDAVLQTSDRPTSLIAPAA
jgi:hypothetical protein